MDFRISKWISGFQSGILDFRVDFWISDWISVDSVRDFFRGGPLVAFGRSCGFPTWFGIVMNLRSPAAFWWKGSNFQNVQIRTHLLQTYAVQQVACLHCMCDHTVSNTFHTKGLETPHRLFYSTNPNPEYGRIKQGWMKVSAMIKAFMSGTKSLYGDLKQSFKLRVEKESLKISTTAPTKDFPFSREQMQLIYKVAALDYYIAFSRVR